MKALTVRQPWAWAIIYGGKDIENRTAAWKYRGPLAIHAGASWSDRGEASPLIQEALYGRDTWSLPGMQIGHLIGVVDLVDIHVAAPEDLVQTGPREYVGTAACCESRWAEQAYQEASGKVRRDITHLILANPRPIVPVRCKGRLGLWDVPDELIEDLP